VYRALDNKTNEPLNTALKKCRGSQLLRRPTLLHEARVLHALQGHPNIPLIFGYGHLRHFEYMSLELLGKSLKDVVGKSGTAMDVFSVTAISVQMVRSASFTTSKVSG
jgi:serine/threonine protein kinase